MEIEKLSLAEIVASKPEAAQLFENYNLDYCCGGKRKLSEALQSDAQKIKEVTGHLEKLFESKNGNEVNFNELSLTELVDHIVGKHHKYVKENLPLIQQHLEKVASKHGAAHIEMKSIKILFDNIKREFEQHMMKEEVILFPRIKKMEMMADGNNVSTEGFAIQGPINVMEYEHESAHQLMEEIKRLSNNFTAPESACTTHRLSLDELKIFEKDLHQHVHLENNILFPKAMEMFSKLSPSALN